MSAVVAFDRWPDGGISTRVQTLVLDERPAAIKVSAGSTAPSATASAAARALGATPVGARVVTPGRLLVGDDNLSGTERTAGGVAPQTAAPGTPLPKIPKADPTPILDAISNPSTATSQVADGTQAITDGAADAVGELSPDAGEAVAATGEAAADALRKTPLPAHVLPGY